MALFGLFGKKSEGSALKKHIERATNKRAQAIDRWESIQVLVRAGTEDAIEGLLPRFGFYVDPSITDQDEKDAAFSGIVSAGAQAVPPVRAYLRRAESIAWPLKLLDALCTPEEVVAALIEELSRMDTEYERDPQRKIDIVAALGERKDPAIVSTVTRFLGDANETVRFSTVGTLLAQPEASEAVSALVECLSVDESLRVRNRILDGLAERGLEVPDAARQALQKSLAPGYSLDASGRLQRRS